MRTFLRHGGFSKKLFFENHWNSLDCFQRLPSRGARSILSKLWWAPEVRSMKTCPTFILCPSLPRLAATLWQLGPRWSFGCKLAPEWVGLQLGVRPSGSGSRWDHRRQPSHWSSKAARGCSIAHGLRVREIFDKRCHPLIYISYMPLASLWWWLGKNHLISTGLWSKDWWPMLKVCLCIFKELKQGFLRFYLVCIKKNKWRNKNPSKINFCFAFRCSKSDT